MNRYEKYKPTSIEWIKEIPEHWNEIRLKYIGFLYSGLSGKNGEDFKQEINLLNKPFIPFTNVANNTKINPGELQYVLISQEENQNQVKVNDLFFMMSSENFDDVGKSTILVDDLGEVYLNSFCKGFRVTDKEVNSLFLNYLLACNPYRKRIMIEANGFTRINLKMDKINDFLITLPPKVEQTAIANFLDVKTAQIDKLIANKQQLIELLKKEKTAIINEAVSGKGKNWKRKKLKYVATLREEEIEDCKFKIAVENIESGSGKLVNMSEKKIYQGSLAKFKAGDTIFNKLRPYLHKVYLAEKDGGLYGELLILFSKGEIIPSFLYYKLFSKSFIDIVDGSTQGTKMPRANWADFISQLLISFPENKDEQLSIVQQIDTSIKNIDNIIAKTQIETEFMMEYRTALISEVVTGKQKVI